MRRNRNALKRSSSASDEPKSSITPFLSNNNNALKWKFVGGSSKTNERNMTASNNSVSLEQAYHELKLRTDIIPTITENKTICRESPSTISSTVSTTHSKNSDGPHWAKTASTNHDESRRRKIATRIISGIIMVSVFLLVIYLGHFYICGMIFLMEAALVRYTVYTS